MVVFFRPSVNARRPPPPHTHPPVLVPLLVFLQCPHGRRPFVAEDGLERLVTAVKGLIPGEEEKEEEWW